MRALAVLATFTVGVALYAASNDDLPFDKFDVGPPIQKDRPTHGFVEPFALGSTGYRAELLVSHYTDDPHQTPQFVTISVQKAWQEGHYVVCFERQFRACDLPKWILTATTRDIAKYDQNAREVTFDFGFTSFCYTLPEK
jgi:hypothetical protein